MSRTTIIVVAVVVVAILGIGAYYIFMPKGSGAPQGGQATLPTQTITIGSTSITAEVASTDPERKQGLSNRPALAQGAGMLFIFDKDGNWGIWMLDMKFSIDIIWADSGGKVIAVDSNISPATYPTVFYPNNNARYVLEVPAGFAAQHGITSGSKMSLPR